MFTDPGEDGYGLGGKLLNQDNILVNPDGL